MGEPVLARDPVSFRLTRWLFLRLLGLVFLIAILSLWSQIEGLVGSGGILPFTEFLDGAKRAIGAEAYWRLPTLAWFGDSDLVLHLLCGGGVLLSLMLIAGVAPLPVLISLWAVYLSLTVVGWRFLSFQWDILLLETAFVSLFLAPLQWRPRFPASQRPPRRIGLWLIRLLLFKLMFLSGIVKLISMDPSWWELTALDYHYFTQPLPVWTSWYAHHLPVWFQRLSVLLLLIIEVGAPFLIFTTRRLRIVACGAIVSLMLLIGATGNYTFFNLLTVVLCVSLLDDAFLGKLVPRRLRPIFLGKSDDVAREPASPRSRVRSFVALVPNALAAMLILLSSLTIVRECVRTRQRTPIEGVAGSLLTFGDRYVVSWGQRYLLRWTDPFHLASGYGLFRAMTTSRPEIVIEGSNDGREWREYSFRWKVGDPSRRPGFVAPHQPRLDWQMWFAALNPGGNSDWLQRLMQRILAGSPEVLALLGPNPFPEAPPRWVRLAFYTYEFTTPAEREETGNWWKRLATGTSRAFPAPPGDR